MDHARHGAFADRVCRLYRDRAEFARRSRESLAEGITTGQQVWCISPGAPNALPAELAGLSSREAASRDGGARVVSLGSAYPAGTAVDPESQVRVCAEATEAAVAAGYRGLRVAADRTALVATPEQLAAFVRYEHKVDRYMALRPFTAMCAYHHSVGEHASAVLATVHPADNTDATGFRFSDDPVTASALSGELDLANGELFGATPRTVDPVLEAGQIVIDATALEFIDHRNLPRPAEHAVRHDSELVLRGNRAGRARLRQALELHHVRVEPAA